MNDKVEEIGKAAKKKMKSILTGEQLKKFDVVIYAIIFLGSSFGTSWYFGGTNFVAADTAHYWTKWYGPWYARYYDFGDKTIATAWGGAGIMIYACCDSV